MRLVLRLAMRIRRAKMRPNATGIVGLTGRAETSIAHEGTIFVRGELWPAHSRVNIAPGETVRVTGLNGFTLEIEPDEQTWDQKV